MLQMQKALIEKQAVWTAAHKACDGKMASMPESHPIVAGIYQAADFAWADNTTAIQAAGVVELLCGLLQPERLQRIFARDVNSETHPWLFDAGCGRMPSCPVQM